jgi:hypothetical protein
VTRSRLTTAAVLIATCAPLATGRTQSLAYYEQTYLHASYNFALRYRFPSVDGLFNSFDYGHSILYETLWRKPDAPNEELDEKQFRFITTHLLRRPPSVPLDEAAIAPNWNKVAPEIVMTFDWAHMLHRQLYDIWSDDRIPLSAKDDRVREAMDYYRSRPALALSSKPKSMNLMEGQPYSLTFRKRFPRYNGLIWSYHWLQMALYDALMAPIPVRQQNVETVVRQFWDMLDYSADKLPTTMPQSAAIAPCFSQRYPEAAIIFDNLHSLHDVVSDILASPSIPHHRKRDVLLEAAARYRDSTSYVTTVAEWRTMSLGMGLAKMGGAPSVAGRDTTQVSLCGSERRP